jgi:hypothetical protein
LLGGSNSAQTVRRGHRWEPGRRTGGSTRHSPVCGPRGRRGKAPHYWPCSSDGDEAKNPAAHAGRTESLFCRGRPGSRPGDGRIGLGALEGLIYAQI